MANRTREVSAPKSDQRPARSARGQAGSVLMFVLAVVIMLTIGVMSMLFMSQSMVRTSTILEETAADVHRLDGAMEFAVNTVRRTADMCNGDAGNGQIGNPLQVVHVGVNDNFQSDYDVYCEKSDPPSGVTPDASTRYVDLRAAGSGGVTVGKARVRILDSGLSGGGGSTIEPGFMMVVCDWVLTGSLVAEVGALDWCPPAEGV